MLIEPKQIYNDKIVRLWREIERTKYNTNGKASKTLIELDTNTKEQL